MNRRSLLGGMLAACAAPAIVRASSLMRTPKVPPDLEMMSCTMTLNRFGEIIVDAGCHTSVPGVFAAGDATTVPYKQIVIAASEGAKAALSAFDYLMRQPVAAN